MFNHVIRVGFVVLLAATAESLRRQLSLPRDPANDAPPADKETWEGEGGALPVTGSHNGPAPETP